MYPKRGEGTRSIYVALAAGVIVLVILLGIGLLLNAEPKEDERLEGFTSSTEIVGKVVDQDNNPVAGEKIFVEWVALDGRVKTKIFTTLSEEEARQLGDEELYGSFIVPQGTIRAQKGSKITVRTQPRYSTVDVAYAAGFRKEIGPLLVLRNEPPPTDQRIALLDVGATDFAQEVSKSVWFYILENFFKLLGILFVGFIGYLFYRLYRLLHIKKRTKEILFGAGKKGFAQTTLSKLVVKHPHRVDPGDSTLDVARYLVEDALHSLLVQDHTKVVGIVTEKDLLENTLHDEHLSSLKARDVMIKNMVTVQQEWDLAQTMQLLKVSKLSKVVVVSKKKLKGMITVKQFLTFFLDYLKEGKKISDVLHPRVTEYKNNTLVFVKPTDTLKHIITKMHSYQITCCLVSSHADTHHYYPDLGIITSRDIIEEFYKNPDGFLKLKAAHVMRTPLITVKPTEKLTRAVEELLQAEISQAPVVVDNRILGMLHLEDTLEPLYRFIREHKG